MPGAPVSEQQPFAFVADEAIARIYSMLNAPGHKLGEASLECGRLWYSLAPHPYKRLVWCHAACLDGGLCLRSWPELSLDARTSLLLALESMIDFFQQAGAR
jgi:hypothetical protein